LIFEKDKNERTTGIKGKLARYFVGVGGWGFSRVKLVWSFDREREKRQRVVSK